MTSSTPSISVLLVDDHALIRRAIRELLETHADIRFVGEAANGDEAIALTKDLKPDVVVLDIRLPDINGLVVAEILAREAPASKIILLSAELTPETLRHGWKTGVHGILNKDQIFEDLAKAIRAAADGVKYIPERH